MGGGIGMSERMVAGLFVDDEEKGLPQRYMDNLEIELEQRCQIRVSWRESREVEEAKRLLKRGQSDFGLVVVDLLWDPIGPSTGKLAPRGLEIVEQAAETPGVVIVAVSIGDTLNYPDLEERAREAGAHIFIYRSALAAASRRGGWGRLALDICQALEREGNKVGVSKQISRETAEGTSLESRRKRIFVVSGRNQRLTRSILRLLKSLGLEPYEWEQIATMAVREKRRGGNPNIFDIVELGFERSQGVLVVFSPDDEARLSPLLTPDDSSESELIGQPRPNVLLEAGYALSRDREHTLIVSVGQVRAVSDLAGMHLVYLDDSSAKRKIFADRLDALGFDVDISGQDWLSVGELHP
jgi:predicted nucleotide-binding protein